jgi:hypothetical protein
MVQIMAQLGDFVTFAVRSILDVGAQYFIPLLIVSISCLNLEVVCAYLTSSRY